MPKVAGTYAAIVTITKELVRLKAESKQDAIRMMLLRLAAEEDRTAFVSWVEGGMQIELAGS